MTLVLLTSALAPATLASAAQPTATLTFAAALDEDVAGGQWALTTTSGVDETVPVVLRSGDLPAGNVLSVEVPIAELQAATTSNHFILRVYRVIDIASAYFATATTGLTPSAIAAGGTIDLGFAPSHLARTYASAE